jgi:hypothetical protein
VLPHPLTPYDVRVGADVIRVDQLEQGSKETGGPVASSKQEIQSNTRTHLNVDIGHRSCASEINNSRLRNAKLVIKSLFKPAIPGRVELITHTHCVGAVSVYPHYTVVWSKYTRVCWNRPTHDNNVYTYYRPTLFANESGVFFSGDGGYLKNENKSFAVHPPSTLCSSCRSSINVEYDVSGISNVR